VAPRLKHKIFCETTVALEEPELIGEHNINGLFGETVSYLDVNTEEVPGGAEELAEEARGAT